MKVWKHWGAGLMMVCLLVLASSCAVQVGRRVRPAESGLILGRGYLKAEQLAAFLVKANPVLAAGKAAEMASLYVAEAALEGLNHDVAFAQMCLETGYLRFGNLVTADMNNFCGLGSIGGDVKGARFPTAQLGVRAHIQHLQAYASTAPLKEPLVDPRYKYVRRGSAPTVDGLAGRWASDPGYSNKIYAILERMYNTTY